LGGFPVLIDAQFRGVEGSPPQGGGSLVRILRYLSLRPYGDSLLTPAGAFWIFAVRIAILLMASAEAISWSYAAFYLATGGLRLAAGVGAFLFTFATVCLIDASLMTLDRWARRYDHRVTSEPAAHWANRAWDGLSIGTRVALVALSMYITAPFLAQLMFNDDIERALADERVAKRAEARQGLLAPLEARMAALETQLDERRAALDAEVAGISGSGRYGDGAAARQIRSSVVAIDTERTVLAEEHGRLALEFDALSDEDMAARYNVALPGDSFQERARALAAIKNDSYRLTERAVQAFLGFLFVALVLLKLFEPRSVKVYFSERLQGLYRQYQGGLFDPHLDPAERSIGSAPMTPLRFEDWCLNTYPAVRARDVNTVTAGERSQFFGNSASELNAITAAVVGEESRLIEELAKLETKRQQAIVERADATRKLATAEAQLAEIKSQRVTLEGGLKRPSSGQGVTMILSTLSELEAAAATAAAQKTAAEARLDALTPLAADLEKRCADLAARVELVASTRQRAETELADARLRHMTELSRAIAARRSEVPDEPLDTPEPHEEPKHVM
jgi:hypothetical protein